MTCKYYSRRLLVYTSTHGSDGFYVLFADMESTGTPKATPAGLDGAIPLPLIAIGFPGHLQFHQL